MQTLLKLLLVAGLLLMACSCSFFDRSPDNFTDTVRLVTKRVLGDPNTPYKPPGPSIAKLTLIRQKTDSILKLTYYWNYPDSTEMFTYIINIKNDTFQLIEPSDLTFIRVFEDKEDPSIKLYKYETMKIFANINLSFILCKEYGQVGAAFYAHNAAVLVTHWNGEPLDKRYQELLKDNLKLILTPEWESLYERRKRFSRNRLRRSKH